MRKILLSMAVLFMAIGVKAQTWTDVALHSSVTHVQPMTGLVLWPDEAEDRNGTYREAIQLEYAYCLPCKVVKGCNADGSIIYDWTWFDNILKDVASRGHQLIARFRYEYPSGTDVDKTKGSTAVPQYIKDLPDYSETYNKVSGDGPTYYADWSNEELKRFTKVFYTDLSARYSDDPRLAFLEVGFGHWSEYHIYGTSLLLGRNFPSHEYQKEFFLHLQKVMDKIPWAISIDAADDEYAPFTSTPELMSMSFGLFDDSFMHKDHEIGTKDGYNEECWNAMGPDRWQHGVCGGEISYYRDSDQKNFLNPAGMYGHTWEEQAAKYHITFMIANDAPAGTYGTARRFSEAGMASGYHFMVKQCRTNGSITEMTVTNTGIAPLYRDAYFAIGGVRSSETLRGLLPGDELSLTIPAALEYDANGTALHNPTIESDAILPSQEIQYDCNLTDAIASHQASSTMPQHSAYNTMGQRISPDGHGIIIINGKKHVR